MSSQSPRTGVVLAAGFGSRLAGVNAETQLKPLTPVAGKPLLLRTLDVLEKAGCANIVVVLGHGAENVEQQTRNLYHGKAVLSIVVNDKYELSNGVSVLTARPYVKGDFILTMADHIFGREVVEKVKSYSPPENSATLLVDYKLESIFDMDDATKVYAEEGKIVRIGKQIDNYNCVDSGLFICTQALFEPLEKVFLEKGDASLSDGVGQFSKENRMFVLDIGDGFWQDVDTPEMLKQAERMLKRRDQGV